MEDRKRSRDESEELDLEVKRLRENLLETLDDDDDGGAAEFCTATQDLDSFMKSFEEQIVPSPRGDVVAKGAGAGESRLDLGYLLEASDDELGLPPSSSSSGEVEAELARVDSEVSELGSVLWEIPDFDSYRFGFGVSEDGGEIGNGGEYVALDGLFDYSDVGFGSGGVVPRPETLPAL